MTRALSTEAEQAPPESLFHQLFGGRSHIEVNVSKAFAVCFRECPPFATAVLALLHKTCRVRESRRVLQWRCDTEVAFTKGRPDIEIHTPGLLFRLESKVGAPLTKRQLLNYRCRKPGQYLLAVTKRPPDVERAWLAKKKAFALRWQDVHRTVAAASAKGQDRYLRDSFCLYLEELGMAHREVVRPEDLHRLYDLLDTIAASDRKWRSVNPRNAFDVAESCLHLLREVARDAREELPALREWSRRGPFYSKNRDDYGDYWHHLGFFFRRNRFGDSLGGGLSFQQGGGYAKWEVWRIRKKSEFEDRIMEPFKSVCAKSGTLDRGKMLRAFVKSARLLEARMKQSR